MKADLTELAERVEALMGPSYDLDCKIWDAIYPGERLARFEKLTAKGRPLHGRLGPADVDGYVQPLRAFTASLDAAMTLVPEVAITWHCGKHQKTGEGQAYILMPGMRDPIYVVAATPAIALTAACLRAIAAGGE